ncbi:hypothetical protein LTS08_004473 [Lithohypha guttulata]|uniref:cAMP-dependent protein kinase regulatory subunit n=1 Tax=Lithohypha guttulata TaxID=1690604 RepID=A0AAN7STX7_9EURO|nr:hypothetical protein LTR05_008126 [Lithohypha guttulata]KAK5102013.1 hypothetical protein LTS08_004473 [Lithohypha guttulata]
MPSLEPSYQQEVDALLQDLSLNKPKDVVQHCANYFNRKLESERASHHPASSSNMADTAGPFDRPRNPNAIEEEEEERDTFGSPTQPNYRSNASPFSGSSPFSAGSTTTAGSLFGNWMGGHGATDDAEAAQHTPANFPGAGRRTSVSAEAMQPDADSGNWRPPHHQKTPDQLERLRAAVSSNFLFTHLDEESFSLVLGALGEKAIPAANIRVINQGDEGDYFYVIESGEFDVYIHGDGAPAGADVGKKVATVGSGGSFGELALMYNAPRAATVVSTGKSMLWQLDRITFRKILMTNASERRKMYEGFLEDVPLLAGLKQYERAKIADALETVKFAAGQNIITEGEPGTNFYMLESGNAQAFKQGVDHPVKEYKRGDYFGELALLNDRPRAASVIAQSDCKVARLGRDGFKRLLGPVESTMRQQEYEGHGDPLQQSTTAT